MKNTPIVVLLNTKKLADKFFNLTNMPFPSCGCAKTNWDYEKETAYKINIHAKNPNNRYEFGNIRQYKSPLTPDVIFLSVDDFIKISDNVKLEIAKLINVEFEEVKIKR